MAADRLTAEQGARWVVIGILIGIPLAAIIATIAARLDGTVELHARVAEAGGWTPAELSIPAGEPLRLRLTSDDVMHGFAIGQSADPAVAVAPGEIANISLTFDRPGRYVFYCTSWCGLGHWRMRGTIEVTGRNTQPVLATQPLYVTLGLDLDSPRTAINSPSALPSAVRGARLGVAIPAGFLTTDYYRTHSPAQLWDTLRADPAAASVTDAGVWDLVAFVWRSNATVEALKVGERLYAANCTACHGESGAGDGVAADALARNEHGAMAEFGEHTQAPANFADAQIMLSASPALLQGKIIRGGMGTGMPYWGPIFTEPQAWALVDYLWTFQFQYQEAP